LTNYEEAEFSELVLRQSRFVFRVAYAVLLNVHDAEDAAQETFLKLYRNGGWRGLQNERAFLARATWRVAQDSRRQRGCGGGMHSAIVEEEASAAAELPSSMPSPEQEAVEANQQAQLHKMIDALPDDLRVPLVLLSFEELNSREIGRILAIPEGTVRTRIQRARQMLRQKLAAIAAGYQEAPHARQR
jgi:RNA polymerase sigma-70 factor (ECF subfamily)